MIQPLVKKVLLINESCTKNTFWITVFEYEFPENLRNSIPFRSKQNVLIKFLTETSKASTVVNFVLSFFSKLLKQVFLKKFDSFLYRYRKTER